MRFVHLVLPLSLLSACVIRTGPGAASGTQPPPPPPAAGAPAAGAPAAAAPAAAAPAQPAPQPTAAPAPPAAPPPGKVAMGPTPLTPLTPITPAAPPGGKPGQVTGAPAGGVDPGTMAPPAAQPPVSEPPAVAGPPAAVAPNVSSGQPPNLKPGAPAAYWVWRDAAGVWHVRTTTAGKLHRFQGKVTGQSGDPIEVKAVKAEMSDRLKAMPKQILFAFDTAGHMDGFDFRISDGKCATFHFVQNDGKKIFVGSSEAQPPKQNFTVCP